MYESRDQAIALEAVHDALDGSPAPCGNYPDAFYPDFGGEESASLQRQATTLCKECPARFACLEYALKWEEYGVWGGMLAYERKNLRRYLKVEPRFTRTS